MPHSGLTGILSTIGRTPLVELTRLLPGRDQRLYAKLERFNPGGSIKDRTALSMLRGRIQSGALPPGSIVVESSSGNLAVGLAQICRYHGLRFICVVDARTTEQNLGIMRAYGTEVEVVTEGDPETGEFLPVRLRRVRELLAELPGAYWPNQYANPLNPGAHGETMSEIVTALGAPPDYLFCATSTFGTLRGCSDHARAHSMPTTVVGVDALGSAIFVEPGGRPPAVRRLIPGHGASVRPALADPSAADAVVHVTDQECVVACRRLVNREAILAGGSSGATVAALERLTAEGAIAPDATCVLIFPDGGDRYLGTIYDDAWVTTHFGEISHLWKTPPWEPTADLAEQR
ncbi:2,3-diaminopropionate biosynthesis protein SbnA [Actinomadura roseirufa]|uniref:2,3-diaminopropionate biosynthesis protein SbnA n=1 Tax=Actinomadura roseirufa TaxID=2094049 RepID=UPI0010412E8A|nr:2,3-diaminopropionate biosynthesis protein SbnA [Actinomadura roseirufa]